METPSAIATFLAQTRQFAALVIRLPAVETVARDGSIEFVLLMRELPGAPIFRTRGSRAYEKQDRSQ